MVVAFAQLKTMLQQKGGQMVQCTKLTILSDFQRMMFWRLIPMVRMNRPVVQINVHGSRMNVIWPIFV